MRRCAALLLAGAFWGTPSQAAEPRPGAFAPADGSSARLTQLALDIHRYRLQRGPRVVLNPDRSASTVAVCLSFPNQGLGVSREDLWKVRLLQTAWPEGLGAATRKQLGWRSLSEQRELAWDVASFGRVVPEHDLEFGIWTMAEQSQDVPAKALPDLYRKLVSGNGSSPLALRARAADWFFAGSPRWESSHGLEPLSGPLLDSLQALGAGFWRTNDAVLALSGAFERERAEHFIAQYFDAREQGTSQPSPTPASRPAEQAQPKRATVSWSSQSSRVFFGFAIPPVEHPDHAGLRMLARLLNDNQLGRGSDDGLRPMIASTGDTRGSDMLVVEVPISGVGEVDAIERRLRTLLARLAKTAPRPEAMQRAFERERERFWARFETPESRALTLARSEVRHGDARHALRELAEFMRVRPQDVSRVAAAHLAPVKPGVLIATRGGA